MQAGTRNMPGKSPSWTRRVYPRSNRTPPPEVPIDIATDYTEAATILDDSPRASAALSRRALQLVLRDHLGAKGNNLEKEIDSVSAHVGPSLIISMHALRKIGNFGAHPNKDKLTLELIPVEAGEAEWSLDVLDELFQTVFIAPARSADRLAALNYKLTSAGYDPIDPGPGD